MTETPIEKAHPRTVLTLAYKDGNIRQWFIQGPAKSKGWDAGKLMDGGKVDFDLPHDQGKLVLEIPQHTLAWVEVAEEGIDRPGAWAALR